MIAFRQFTKQYGSRTAVDRLSLDVETGEVLAVLGPNGSGKTTSIKAAAGLIAPTTGAVEVGAPPRPASDAAARRACAFLPQKVTFPEQLTAREVVAFHAALRGRPSAPIDDALAAVALGAVADGLTGTFSGGMTQRLGLAVIVAADADLVLLDEPTAALDPDGLAAFHALVECRRAAGRTTVFSSHQLEDVERLADRVAVLVEGRLAACLTAADLADRVAGHGLMRLQVSGLTAAALSEVRLVSPDVTAVDGRMVIRGGATERPAVLAALARHGVTITSLTVQEGRLDEWYRDLVASALPRAAAHGDAPQPVDAGFIGRAWWFARTLRDRR